MSGIAGTYHIVCDQGSTFHRAMTYLTPAGTPYNIVGWAGRMHVRPQEKSPTLLLELTTTNGRITLAADGEIELNVAAVVMEALVDGIHRYDLELVNGAEVHKVTKGNFQVRAEVTR